MVKIELKDGTELNAKYCKLVANTKLDMTPIRDLTEFQFAKTKSDFVKGCLKELGKMYSLNLQPKDLAIPNFKEFTEKVLNQLSQEKARDHFFVSHKFPRYGWRIIRLNGRTNPDEVKRIKDEYDEIVSNMDEAIKKKKQSRNEFYGIGYDERKSIGTDKK